MAIVKIVDMEPFENDKGELVKYKRLCISGYLGGEVHTLEIKLEKSELLLAEILLSSKEEKPVTDSHRSTDEEQEEFQRGITREADERKASDDELEDIFS